MKGSGVKSAGCHSALCPVMVSGGEVFEHGLGQEDGARDLLRKNLSRAAFPSTSVVNGAAGKLPMGTHGSPG